MRNMKTTDFDVHGVGEVISSSGCEEMASTAVTVKEEMYSDELSDVKPDNSFETVLVNSNESVPCPKLEKVPESANDMVTPFLFVGVKMEMPDDYESEVSSENLETQYSSEEYSMNDERECKGVDECSEGSSAMIVNNTSYVQVKKECKEDIEICEFDLQTNDDISVTKDTKCTFDSTSEEQGCDMGHSSEKFINGMEYLEYPILRVKEEGEHPEKQVAENRKNSDFAQNLGELNSEEGKELNKTEADEAETLKSREYATKRLLHFDISKPFSCSICNKCFRGRSDLKRHIDTHSTVKSYSCKFCNACFKSMRFLQKHMKTHKVTHTAEKPYSCDICQKSFSWKSSLIVHSRTHTGEKPYSCDICQKSFALKTHLIRHSRTHTGEKPYSCIDCPASFSSRLYFLKHREIHASIKPFSCNTCQKSFSHERIFKVHMRTHSSEMPFTCLLCGKSFRYRSELKRHMRCH